MRNSFAEHAAIKGVVTGSKTVFGHQPRAGWVSLSDARRAIGSGFEVAKRAGGGLGLAYAKAILAGTPQAAATRQGKREIVTITIMIVSFGGSS